MPPFDPPLLANEIASCFPEFNNIQFVKTGGQGAVFQILHPDYGDCALKIIAPNYEIRTEREVNALRNLSHPTIIKLFHYDKIQIRNSLCPFTITPFIYGKDLQKCINDRYLLNENEAIHLLISMSEALQSLWAKRIVHRDIKPGNILKKDDGSFILIDLGIARHLDRTTYTRWGQWLGTPGYMSPEQAYARRDLTVKSDIFSLGITSFEVFCGEHPFLKDQRKIMQHIIPKNAKEIKNCSELYSDLLAKMMLYRAVLRPTPNDIINILR